LTSCLTLIGSYRKCVLPDSLVQSTTAPSLHVGHRNDRGPSAWRAQGPQAR